MAAERIGIIDLGSNSSRLVIYEIYSNGSYQRVFEMKQNLQLARNMGKAKIIAQNGLARAITCSKLFARAGKLHGVTHWIPVATAAVRQASNQSEVLMALEAHSGFRFHVLNEQEEGRYGYLGVINTLAVEDALLFDIGGASTELMLVRDRQLIEVTSLPFGALNLTEMFGTPPESQRGDLAKTFMAEQFSTISWLNQAAGLPLIGLGGTARAVAKLHRAEGSPRTERIHGYTVPATYVQATFAALKHMSHDKRRKIKGLSKPRSQILVSGLAAIVALMDETSSGEIIISRSGLREGLFYECLLRKADSPRVESVLDHSIRNLQDLFHVNQPIAKMVTGTALILFDALTSVQLLDESQRLLLRVTGEIEGAGYFINTERSNRHSAYLALNSHLYGLSYDDLQNVSDLLEGKGAPALRKLLLLIRLAKLLTLQLGIDPENLHCKVTPSHMEVGCVKGIQETVHSSADADLDQDFRREFGIELVYLEV